jgi:hypothetical protein
MVNITEKHLDSHETIFSETKTATDLLDFLTTKKEFLSSEDASLLSNRKPDELLMLIFENVRKGEKLNFSYISLKEGGRFEYDLSYNRGLHLFTIYSNEQFIGENEISKSRNLSYNDFYSFLSSNKAYLL